MIEKPWNLDVHAFARCWLKRLKSALRRLSWASCFKNVHIHHRNSLMLAANSHVKDGNYREKSRTAIHISQRERCATSHAVCRELLVIYNLPRMHSMSLAIVRLQVSFISLVYTCRIWGTVILIKCPKPHPLHCWQHIANSAGTGCIHTRWRLSDNHNL